MTDVDELQIEELGRRWRRQLPVAKASRSDPGEATAGPSRAMAGSGLTLLTS
jgi:hypothetical protein